MTDPNIGSPRTAPCGTAGEGGSVPAHFRDRCRVGIAVAVFLAAFHTAQIRGQTFATIPVPAPDFGISGITVDRSGNIWATEGELNKIIRIEPSGKRIELDVPKARSYPNQILEGYDGCIWFLELRGRQIGKICANDKIEEVPISVAGGVLGPLPGSIAKGRPSSMWLAGSNSYDDTFLVEIIAGKQVVHQRWNKGGQVNGCAMGADGSIWVTQVDGFLRRVWPDDHVVTYESYRPATVRAVPGHAICWSRIDGEGIVCREPEATFLVPALADFIADGHGSIWATSWEGRLERITAKGEKRSYDLPNPRCLPGALAIGPDGSIYCKGSRPSAIYRFTPPVEVKP